MAGEQEMEQIIELVRALTPRQRRLLLQRLRVSGLLPAETLATDRDRLVKAPALGRRQAAATRPAPPSGARQPAPPATSSPVPATGAQASSPAPAAASGPSTARLPLRFAGGDDTHGRRAGGKVVIGVPADREEPPDPHAMPPLPGQAPEQPINIIFDGGSKGNPGVGYGSYALHWPGQSQQIVQLQFGDGVTNNEAEYDTLVAALESVVKRLAENHADPATARVEIRGDSQLVINQVLGDWKCNDERMRRRRDRVRSLLREFGAWSLAYHPRANSVRVLGH
jgi:probable phosphoglycerate mutase